VQLTSAIRRLAANDLTIDIPSIESENEIGDLAASVHVFRNMALQIEDDLQIMKNLQVKLQESHNLLTTLSRQVPGMICQYRLFPTAATACPTPAMQSMTCTASLPMMFIRPLLR